MTGGYIPGLYDDVLYTTITNYVAFFGYTILVWDHIITLGDEVRFIWQRPHKNFLTYLFFLNRYFTPFAFIGNLAAYFGEWSQERCHHFVRYEGSCTIIALELTAFILLFRVWALYKSKRYGNYIIGSVVLILIAETVIQAWLMTQAQPVSHNVPEGNITSFVKACTMIFNPNIPVAPSLSAWFPLLYDTYVIVLTLYACKPRRKEGILRSNVMMALIRGGLLYYVVIFSVNFILAIMILVAKPPLKNICAQLEQLLTVAMISRITLALMKEGQTHQDYGFDTCENSPMFNDSFRAAPPSPHRYNGSSKRGSATLNQHISVVSRSECSSGTGPRSLRALRADRVLPITTFGVGGDKKKRRFSRVAGGTRFSGSFGFLNTDLGTLSLGSFGVSTSDVGHHDPPFDVEAGATMSPEVIADAAGLTVPSSASFGLSIPPAAVISEPTELTEHDAYELRTLRPSVSPTSGGVLRL